MRSTEEEVSSSSTVSFEFQKGNNGVKRTSHHRTTLGKPTPSKWDDAQKWLVGFSRGGEKNQAKTKPRNSNADDLRLIAPVPQKEQDYSMDSGNEGGGVGGGEEEDDADSAMVSEETKNVDCEDSIWRINKRSQNSSAAVRSIFVRDMGTEMTPIASQEPSRTGTPIRATTPALQSPASSPTSTPARCQNGMTVIKGRTEAINSVRKTPENPISDQARKINALEARAAAWDEAEKTKYMARYKREEMKIQAWENHENRKAEMEMRKMEVKAERMKARAQERLANKLAAARRIAEEKRVNAEAELNEKAVITSETADYIRRTGHLPSSFSFRMPSRCW